MNERRDMLLDEFIPIKVKNSKKKKKHNTNWNCVNEHIQAKVYERNEMRAGWILLKI